MKPAIATHVEIADTGAGRSSAFVRSCTSSTLDSAPKASPGLLDGDPEKKLTDDGTFFVGLDCGLVRPSFYGKSKHIDTLP